MVVSEGLWAQHQFGKRHWWGLAYVAIVLEIRWNSGTLHSFQSTVMENLDPTAVTKNFSSQNQFWSKYFTNLEHCKNQLNKVISWYHHGHQAMATTLVGGSTCRRRRQSSQFPRCADHIKAFHPSGLRAFNGVRFARRVAIGCYVCPPPVQKSCEPAPGMYKNHIHNDTFTISPGAGFFPSTVIITIISL